MLIKIRTEKIKKDLFFAEYAFHMLYDGLYINRQGAREKRPPIKKKNNMLEI